MKLSEWLADEKKVPSAFARDLGLSHTTILRWLDGTSCPSPKAMAAVFAATKGRVTASDLMGQTEKAA